MTDGPLFPQRPYVKPTPPPEEPVYSDPDIADDTEAQTKDMLRHCLTEMRYRCCEIEEIIECGKGLTPKELKRLDKAVTVMKVGMKAVKKVAKQKSIEMVDGQ